MKPILEAIKEKRYYLDGGLGSMLQAAGLPDGLLPDLWSIQNPEAVQNVHRQYLEAGCRLIATNTFGTNAQKLAPYGVTPKEVMTAAVANVRAAMDQAGVNDGYVMADIGPTGKLLKPYGDLDFEDAVALFADTIAAAQEAGADAILIETMTDSYETKAALLAAKENSDLPVLVTNAYGSDGKLMTGATPAAMVAMLEGMGVCALVQTARWAPNSWWGWQRSFWSTPPSP